MVLERVLTAYLKRRFTKTLQLEVHPGAKPPSPERGIDYLLYVHIPFCEELCPYCSFNRFPLDQELALSYFDALRMEIRMYRDLGFRFSAVYVGGGTPTVIPQAIARLLLELREMFPVREVSLETNPNHLTNEMVTLLKEAGVNRLSVGVQSFDDVLLEQMDRRRKYGSGSEIRERLGRYLGVFDTLNVDMIFNFPSQTLAMLKTDLAILEDLRVDQITFYPLMVSDITRAELARRFGSISYRQERIFYETITERLADTYSNGTAWCFSRNRTMIDEYIVDYDEYVGAGSGAFGYTNGACWANTFSVPDYIQALKGDRLPIFAKREFTLHERIQYDFMMKLFGMSLDIKRSEAKFHGQFRKILAKEIKVFKALGAISEDKNHLYLTPLGRYLWVVMMREFFTGVNNFRDICRASINQRAMS